VREVGPALRATHAHDGRHREEDDLAWPQAIEDRFPIGGILDDCAAMAAGSLLSASAISLSSRLTIAPRKFLQGQTLLKQGVV